MINKCVILSALGIWALSCIPTATAASIWGVCDKNAAGVTTCHSKLSTSAKVWIAIGCAFVLLLLLSLVICVIRKRLTAAASEQEYNVEASQVHGPPTIIATEYDPTSGPSGVYGSPKSGFGQTSAQMTGPTYPVAAQAYDQHRTAPVTQSTFPYPFPGYSHMGPTPHTAFVSGGFPRPLLAGDRLKDRLRRPGSASHTLG
jgi:hypothetical protein